MLARVKESLDPHLAGFPRHAVEEGEDTLQQIQQTQGRCGWAQMGAIAGEAGILWDSGITLTLRKSNRPQVGKETVNSKQSYG